MALAILCKDFSATETAYLALEVVVPLLRKDTDRDLVRFEFTSERPAVQ